MSFNNPIQLIVQLRIGERTEVVNQIQAHCITWDEVRLTVEISQESDGGCKLLWDLLAGTLQTNTEDPALLAIKVANRLYPADVVPHDALVPTQVLPPASASARDYSSRYIHAIAMK